MNHQPALSVPRHELPAPCPAAGPLRVLLLSDHLGFAHGAVHGVTTYFLEILPAFDRALVAPTLCVLQPRHAAAARFAAAGIEPMFLARRKWDPRTLLDLLRLVRGRRFALLHVTGEKSILFGRLVARLEGLPVIAHFHDGLPAPRWVRLCQRRLASDTDLALAVSGPIREIVIRDFALPPDRVQVLHNGLDLTRFTRPAADARPRLRRQLGLAPTTPTVGLIGRLHPVKGQQAMIRALPRLLRHCPDAALVIAGDGPDRQACTALVAELGLAGRVHLLGQRDDIPDLLAALDVVALPSLWEEPFPFVALEAMAAGRPVVAFRTGGLPESIVDGETGLLVAYADEDALAEALSQVLTQPELARRLGAGAARRAQDFSIQWHVQRLTELYATVHRRHASGRADLSDAGRPDALDLPGERGGGPALPGHPS
jgi:glycosyltransferase involved in cell wall biosynthesis